jgi:polyhydroxyalkanoate synthesis regulator phasin
MTTKNPLDRLANLGEEVLGKASQNATASRVIQGAMQLKDRVDDLSKRVRGLEAMEKRVAGLERRIAKLETKPKSATSSAKKKSATKKT